MRSKIFIYLLLGISLSFKSFAITLNANATANNGSGGIFFSLTTNSAGVDIEVINTIFSSSASTPVSVELYTRVGPYASFINSNTGWTSHGTINCISAGNATPAPINVASLNIQIPPSTTMSFYIHATTSGGGIRYYGTGSSSVTNFNDANLALFSDVSHTGSVAFAGGTFTPRALAGSIQYSLSGPPCNDPTGVAASSISATGASLSWNAVTGATGYEYAVNTSATPPASGTQQAGTTYNATGLTQGTNYYFHVRTTCSPTSSSSWVTIPFTTLTCASPGAPTSSSVTSNSASFSWGAVTGALGYEYMLTNNSTPPTGSGTATTAISYTAINLTDNTNYCLHVRTECTPGVYSAWVNTCITTLVTPPCARPDTLDITNITATTADLSWNSVPGVTDYEYAITTTAAPPASGTFINGTTYNATGLMSNTQYYAHVRDTCSGGITSPWKTEPFNTPYPPCDPPIATVSNVTDETADVNWGVMPEALSYEVAVFSNPNPPSAAGISTTGTSYTATNLVSGKLYYVHVRSICSFDTSSWGTTTFYSATPQSVTTPGSVTTLKAYPNPVSDVLYIELSRNPRAHAYLSISDITGRVIQVINITHEQVNIDMSRWDTGMYLLKFVDGKKLEILKVYKQ